VTEETRLPESIQSHVDAIATYIVEEHKKAYLEDKEGDKQQLNLFEPEDDEEESDVEEAEGEGEIYCCGKERAKAIILG
jgi:hypothetical protein